MVAAARKSNMAKEAGRVKAQETTVSKLPGKTTPETVRAAVGKALKTGPNYTGQYLYERFVNDAAEQKADVTRMDIIKDMVSKLELADFEKAVSDMVGMAKKQVDTLIEGAKSTGKYDSENPTWTVREAQAQLKTARNHQSVFRLAWGALHFCADELAAKLNGGTLSYKMIRDIGSKLLGDKGIDWKGDKIVTSQDRAARRQQETETAAMLAVQRENPRKDGETTGQYYERMAGLTEKRMKQVEADNAIKARADLAEKIRAMCGDNLPEILDILLAADAKADVQEAPKADKNLH